MQGRDELEIELSSYPLRAGSLEQLHRMWKTELQHCTGERIAVAVAKRLDPGGNGRIHWREDALESGGDVLERVARGYANAGLVDPPAVPALVAKLSEDGGGAIAAWAAGQGMGDGSTRARARKLLDSPEGARFRPGYAGPMDAGGSRVVEAVRKHFREYDASDANKIGKALAKLGTDYGGDEGELVKAIARSLVWPSKVSGLKGGHLPNNDVRQGARGVPLKLSASLEKAHESLSRAQAVADQREKDADSIRRLAGI